MVGHAFNEATGQEDQAAKNDVSDRDVVVLGSGNLGLVYLMEERRRLTLEEIDGRATRELLPALRAHPHVGWLLVRSSEHGAVALGARGAHFLTEHRIEGEDPLAPFSPTAPGHLLRTDGFEHVADIMLGSFYDPELDEGCAFEELISFHGGIGGHQTRAFILHPAHLAAPTGTHPRRRGGPRHPQRLAGATAGRRQRTRRAAIHAIRMTSAGTAAPGSAHLSGDEGSSMASSSSESPVLDLLERMTADSVEVSGLDAQTLMLSRIAALVALDAPPVSYLMNLEAAADVGISVRSDPRRARRDRADRRHRPGRVGDRPRIVGALAVELEVAEMDAYGPN